MSSEVKSFEGLSQTLVEQADQKPLVSLQLCEVSVVRLQMQDWAASTIVFLKFQDVEIWRECRLWEVVEVLELVGLAVTALH